MLVTNYITYFLFKNLLNIKYVFQEKFFNKLSEII